MNSGIREALRPVKRRIRRNRMVRGAAFGLAVGTVCALALLVLSRLVMIPDAKIWAGAALAAAGILCAVGNMLRKVGDREAAVQADRCGLMERAATALDAEILRKPFGVYLLLSGISLILPRKEKP